MKVILRNILGFIGSIILGSVVNMAIVEVSTREWLIKLPEGTDTTTMEGLSAAISQFGPEHFILPFLAHALGTLVGAFLAAKLTATYQMQFAFTVGAFFFLGGAANAYLLPAPAWFIGLDLIVAYIPMAWIGWTLANPKNS